MSRATRPPRLARALLWIMLPRDDRNAAIDALDDKYAELVKVGRRRRVLWYWLQVLGMLHPAMWTGNNAIPGRSSRGDSLGADVRFGLRMLAKSPSTSIVIVLTLAVGLGFNGAVFAVMNTIVRMDLPFEDSHRIRLIDAQHHTGGEWALRLTYPDYAALAESAESLEAVAAWRRMNVAVRRGNDSAERAVATYVSPSIFDVLALQPATGRRFAEIDGEPAAEPVALLGYAAWQALHGADPDILGRAIRVQGVDRTIVGVLPQTLERTPFTSDLWIPITRTGGLEADVDRRAYEVVSRLADGATEAQMVGELDQISARLATEHPVTHAATAARARTYRETYSVDANRAIMFAMTGAVAFLLLIACANVANLLVSRTLQRGRELAVRAALGASRWRLVRQLLVESVLLSVIGMAGGLLMATWGNSVLAQLLTKAGAPRWFDFRMGIEVHLMIIGLSLATGIAFGLAPAAHAARARPGDVLKESGRGTIGNADRYRFTTALVILQITLAVVLLAGAGVTARSAINVEHVDWGLDTDLLTMRLTLGEDRYRSDESLVEFHRQLEQRVSATPGVEAVGLASNFPSRGGLVVMAELEHRLIAAGHRAQTMTQVIIGSNYFELAGVDPLHGRFFTEDDGADGELVVVVEQRLADRYWPDEDPVGKRLRWEGAEDARWMSVIGVAPPILQSLPMEFLPDFPVIYTPYRAEPQRAMGLMVRASTEQRALAAALRNAVRRIDPELPLYAIDPLERLLEESTFSWRIIAQMFGLLGAVALFLSCLGIYAVMSSTIGHREQEIGVRMAVGARAQEVVRLVLRSVLWQASIGLAIGTMGALFTTRLLGMFMFGTSSNDPLTLSAAIGLLLATTLAAGWLPARRASRLDPLQALRSN